MIATLRVVYPAVVHDLAVHPREHELIVATHGRQVKASVKELQQIDQMNDGKTHQPV